MDEKLPRTLAILAAVATILLTCIAVVALIPEFGQWLSPREPASIPPSVASIILPPTETANEATSIPEEVSLVQTTAPSQADQIAPLPNSTSTKASPTGTSAPLIEPINTTAPTRSSLDPLETEQTVILSENADNKYNWTDGGIYVTSIETYEGNVSFISKGNNAFEKELGTIGYEKDEARYISFKAFLLEEDAALLLQVKMDGDWEHRWGFDGRESYKGGYRWNRRGQTLDMPARKWIDVKLDLIDDLGGRPGQIIRGLALSGADGNFLYDFVTLSNSETFLPCPNSASPKSLDAQEKIILSSSDDYEKYSWTDGKLYKTTQFAYQDDVSFIPNGNATAVQEFGIIGYEPNEIRYISFQVCLIDKEAGLLLQTKVDGSWEHRWEIDGRNSYQGVYGWNRRGVLVNIPTNEWSTITIDMIEDLEARPGQKLNGLAFSALDGNMAFDRLTFIESE